MIYSDHNSKAGDIRRRIILHIIVLFVCVIVTLLLIPLCMAFQATAYCPVELNVTSSFSLSLTPLSGGSFKGASMSPASASPSTNNIDFGTYTTGGNLSSKSVEIYCSSNTGNDWQVDISGNAFEHTVTGVALNGSPNYWSWAPAPGNPGDFQQARGQCYSGSLPANSTLYDSCPGETGEGILVMLGMNANLHGMKSAGNYSTVVTITMHE